jgi:hypothetical protein
LLFQVLDSKKECRGIYCEGQITQDYEGLNLTHSWAPSAHFKDQKLDYAQLWVGGQSLREICPPELLAAYSALDKKARAYLQSFSTAKINLDEICFYDLVPESFLLDFFKVKSDISQFVFDSHDRPKNYEFLHDLLFFLMDIKNKDLKLDFKNLNLVSSSGRDGLNKIKDSCKNIVYNPWTTVTGRLTTEKNSFPVLTINRGLRSVIKPHNDCFVELDYNAAEVRVLFGLLGQDQPKQDIHEWISKNIFEGKYDRENTKKKVFSWLYNPKAKNKRLNDYIDRDMICNQYYIDGSVATPYNRVIKVGEEKALNYLIQSTASDMFLTSAMKVAELLRHRKSFVSFCIHDSLIVDLALEDREILDNIGKEFSDTRFGTIKTNLSIGKDFGKMKRVI